MTPDLGREKSRIEKVGDLLYFLFQTLPVIVALVILTVAAIGYGLVKLAL